MSSSNPSRQPQDEAKSAPPLPPRSSTPISPSFPPRTVSLDSNPMHHVAEAVASNTFNKVTEYIRHEVLTAMDDMNTLQTLTSVVRDRYTEYNLTAQELIAGMGAVQQTCMEVYIDQIFQMEREVSNMEHVVAELDEYTKRLETNLKRQSK
ncbi:hypothetical protein DFS34DRAFT_651192 [Phlyctochytrium arcticum]|nr:hypothetical protein DFS34DRAFT_651192 [Phlyctochytrium arcticum]